MKLEYMDIQTYKQFKEDALHHEEAYSGTMAWIYIDNGKEMLYSMRKGRVTICYNLEEAYVNYVKMVKHSEESLKRHMKERHA